MLEPPNSFWMLLTADEVDARDRHVRAEAVDQQHRGREGDLLADVGDLEGVEDGGEHGRAGPSGEIGPGGMPDSRGWAGGPAGLLDDRAAAAGGLDGRPGTGAEGVGVDVQRLAELALGEDLHGHPLRVARPWARSSSSVTSVPASKRLSSEDDVDRLGVGAEGLERHRLLHVGAAQLSHAHVDRHLTALEVGPALAARAGAGALLSAPGGLAGSRSLRRGRRACAAGGCRARGRGCADRRCSARVLRGGAHRSLRPRPGGGRRAACPAPGGCR